MCDLKSPIGVGLAQKINECLNQRTEVFFATYFWGKHEK